jgi:adenylylsulfate kinase-like enzyme
MSVLWLFGPPGVGKSTVGWALHRRWRSAGMLSAYVDIDQLGMLYPTPDPRNHHVKVRNLAAVLRTFAAAGAERTVVSGVIDPDEMADFAAHGCGAGWVWCRLTAAQDEIRDRLVRQRQQPEMVEGAAEHAALLDSRDIADLRVDTTGRTVDEIVEALDSALDARALDAPSLVLPARDDEGEAAASFSAGPAAAESAAVIAVTGGRATGKSTVAWEVFQRVQRDGRVAAYIDLEQVGFVGEPRAAVVSGVRVANVAAMADVFGGAGAEVLVLSGAIGDRAELDAYSAGLAPAELTVVRLRAGEVATRERVATRAVQRAMHLPGDDLRDLPPEDQEALVRESLREGAELDAAGVGHPIDTDGRSVEQIADDILARARLSTPSTPGR